MEDLESHIDYRLDIAESHTIWVVRGGVYERWRTSARVRGAWYVAARQSGGV